jgi:hypothetical protein
VSQAEGTDDRQVSIITAARRLLDAYGHAAPETSRVVYADGDLNIGGEGDTLEIIYRGTLVFRYPHAGDADYLLVGDWIEIVERMARDVGK